MEFALIDLINGLPWWQLLLIASLTSFSLTYITIPVIVVVSNRLGIYEKNKKRGSHNGSIPTLGGVAISFGIVIAAAFFTPVPVAHHDRYILAAIVILFFTGLKDDLLVIDPKKKLLAQIMSALVVILLADVRITTFHGFANIHEISYWVSVIFSVFLILVIINGFNLIDGIDGLSSGVAILTSVAFGTLFIFAGAYDSSFRAFILAGSLIAFFRFNLFSKENKIFLGDTGSLTIGFIMAIITINFLECKQVESISKFMTSLPVLAFGILIIPLFDTLRVFTIRIFRGESPLHADRKHIHHRLLTLGLSHLKATLIILSANLIILFLILIFRELSGIILVAIILFLAAGLSYIPVYLIYKQEKSLGRKK